MNTCCPLFEKIWMSSVCLGFSVLCGAAYRSQFVLTYGRINEKAKDKKLHPSVLQVEGSLWCHCECCISYIRCCSCVYTYLTKPAASKRQRHVFQLLQAAVRNRCHCEYCITHISFSSYVHAYLTKPEAEGAHSTQHAIWMFVCTQPSQLQQLSL